IVDALERIAPIADMEASAMLRMALEREGIEIATSVFVKSVRRDGEEVAATIAPRDGSDEYEVRVERVMLASGRVPNIEELGRDDRRAGPRAGPRRGRRPQRVRQALLVHRGAGRPVQDRLRARQPPRARPARPLA